MFFAEPELLDWIDDLEESVTQMPGTTLGIHNVNQICVFGRCHQFVEGI